MQFIRVEGRIFLHHVPGVLDQLGLSPPDQAVGPLAQGGVDPPGDGEHIPPLLQGPSGGDEGAAGLAPLHHQHPQAQAGDEAVTHRKMGAGGRGARGILAEQRPGRRHVLIEVPMSGGINHVNAAAQHRHHPAAAPQRPPEGGGVHPLGHAADHQGPLPGQIQPQPAGGHDSIGAGLAGPHQGHGGLLVHLGQPSPAIEHAGSAVQLAQPLGIGRVLAG